MNESFNRLFSRPLKVSALLRHVPQHYLMESNIYKTTSLRLLCAVFSFYVVQEFYPIQNTIQPMLSCISNVCFVHRLNFHDISGIFFRFFSRWNFANNFGWRKCLEISRTLIGIRSNKHQNAKRTVEFTWSQNFSEDNKSMASSFQMQIWGLD